MKSSSQERLEVRYGAGSSAQLILDVAKAASSHLELAEVLEALIAALKPMIRFDAMLRTQPPREFETDHRAHAVTKQCERSIEMWKDLASQRFNERLDPRVSRFS